MNVKTGRPRSFKKLKKMSKQNLFKDSHDLYSWFQKYKQHCQALSKKYWKKVHFVGKDGKRVEVDSVVPYTIAGFNAWSWENGRGHVKNYLYKTHPAHELYNDAIEQILDEIRDNQILGGMLGFYNPGITARLNSLADHKDVKSGGKDLSSIDIRIVKD